MLIAPIYIGFSFETAFHTAEKGLRSAILR
jgi:hypothetical protein